MSIDNLQRGVSLSTTERTSIEHSLEGYARPELVESMLDELSAIKHFNGAAKADWGYAIFARGGGLQYFHVPYPFLPSITRGPAFDLIQLMAAARIVKHYFILSVHKDSATLLRCDPFTEQVIDRYNDVVIHQEGERERSLHSVGRHHSHGGSVISHVEIERNEGHEVLRYFNALDNHVSTLLRGDPAPLFVASQEREGSTFLRHTRNPKVRKELLRTIRFDDDIIPAREEADSILERDRKTELVHALDEYSFQSSRGATCRDLADMHRYAEESRIAILFVERGNDLPEISEILRLAVLKHAEVYVLDPEMMPTRGASAILRY